MINIRKELLDVALQHPARARIVFAHGIGKSPKAVHRGVPKDFRYSLGTKIDRSLIETAELLFVAQYLSKEQKLPYLQKANTRLDLAKFFLQVLWDVGALDNQKYILLSEKFDEVGRQLGGWIQGMKSKPPAR